MLWQLSVIAFYLTVSRTNGLYEGDKCDKDGVPGTCINLNNCPSAVEDVKNKKRPQVCSYIRSDPIVCCVDSAIAPPPTPAPRPVATPAPIPKQTTTEYTPREYDYVRESEEECKPVAASLTSPKTGQKAWDKCIEYQEEYIYPCEKSAALTGGLTRGKNCFHTADKLIVGGKNAAGDEFPHMVLLGFTNDTEPTDWSCGGTLLSDWFILTAAHCTYNRNESPVSDALVGTLRRNDKVESSKLYKIKKIIKHPSYKSNSRYNDIALLETTTRIALGPYVVPACLDVGKEPKYEKAIATGWGVTGYGGSPSDKLLKVTLDRFPQEECSEEYSGTRKLKQGINDHTQFCYGDPTASKDTCEGDSGGPLQVKNQNVFCMYTVIGVTSFGKSCGYSKLAVYTKVEAYVDWIENIVWA